MTEPDQDQNRRHSDSVMIALNQRFIDFVERYDRDTGALNEWRRQIDSTLREQDIILKEINPAYRRGLWVFGLIVIASIGVAVKEFWNHITWNG
jgi:hypothetical protein